MPFWKFQKLNVRDSAEFWELTTIISCFTEIKAPQMRCLQ